MTPPRTVIVDLDGTLALNAHRHHYIYPKPPAKPNWDAFHLASVDDQPNLAVIAVVRLLKSAGHKVHIMSARGKIAHEVTLDWLARHQVPYDQLTMRDIGCYTADETLKQQWLLECYPDFLREVLLVLDDRNKVVEMWRSLGLPCFQVAPGDF